MIFKNTKSVSCNIYYHIGPILPRMLFTLVQSICPLALPYLFDSALCQPSKCLSTTSNFGYFIFHLSPPYVPFLASSYAFANLQRWKACCKFSWMLMQFCYPILKYYNAICWLSFVSTCLVKKLSAMSLHHKRGIDSAREIQFKRGVNVVLVFPILVLL